MTIGVKGAVPATGPPAATTAVRIEKDRTVPFRRRCRIVRMWTGRARLRFAIVMMLRPLAPFTLMNPRPDAPRGVRATTNVAPTHRPFDRGGWDNRSGPPPNPPKKAEAPGRPVLADFRP